MCWPHVNRNVDNYLKDLKKESKSEDLHKKVEADICHFQWATTEKEYESSFKALVDKYTAEENITNYNEDEKAALKKFFNYFESVWGPASNVKNWFAGSNPWNITQNQGIEGKNKAIKKS